MPPSVAAAEEERINPRAMLGILRALLDRGLRVFSSEPNVWCVRAGLLLLWPLVLPPD
jgi:hypothetical protein